MSIAKVAEKVAAVAKAVDEVTKLREDLSIAKIDGWDLSVAEVAKEVQQYDINIKPLVDVDFAQDAEVVNRRISSLWRSRRSSKPRRR